MESSQRSKVVQDQGRVLNLRERKHNAVPNDRLDFDMSLRLWRTSNLNSKQLDPQLLWASGFRFQVSSFGLRKSGLEFQI